MDKYIICLANSYKHGGRCLAGIEVTINSNGFTVVRNVNGQPKWLRPVSHSQSGEVPNSLALNIHVLSVVKIVGYQQAGLYSHSEDVYYQTLVVCSSVLPTHSVLKECIDNFHSIIFGNRGKALTPECFQKGDYSLMLVHSENSEIYIDTRFSTPKPRLKFSHNSNNYDFPITDPVFIDRIRAGYMGILPDAYLVLSLGVEHEGWHSKLIAAIIEPREDLQETTSQNLGMEGRMNFEDGMVKCDYSTIEFNPCKVQILPKVTHTEDTNVKLHNNNSKPLLQNVNFKKAVEKKKDRTIRNNQSSITSYIYIQNLESQNKTSTRISSSKSEGCYIATAVYGSYNAKEVLVLRKFRDTFLNRYYIGRLFIKTYYAVSPSMANKLKNHERTNRLVRRLLDKFVLFLEDCL